MQSGLNRTIPLLFAAPLISATSFGQDAPMEAAAATVNTGALHLDLGGEWTNAYYFRGLLQEDNGFIFQSWADLGIDLVSNGSWSLSAKIGIWNSMHDEDDTAGTTDSFTRHWYECDLYGGLTLDVNKWSFGATYFCYTSPSDAFSTIGELDFSIAFDDSGLWNDKFALNPHLVLAIETDDEGGTNDTYLEVGIAPGFTHRLSGKTSIGFTFPIVVGLSIDDYYVTASGDEDTFGYAQVGVDASMGLPISDRYGAWSLNAGVHALFLGDAAKEINNDDDFEVIGRLGISIAY